METEITKANVRESVELYTQVRSRVESEDAALAILQEIGKNHRVEMMCTRDGRSNGNGNGEQNATEKQIGYLRALNVEIPMGLTKKAASELIEQHAT